MRCCCVSWYCRCIFQAVEWVIVDRVCGGKISAGKMSVCKMSVDKMFVDKISLDKMPVSCPQTDKMSVVRPGAYL